MKLKVNESFTNPKETNPEKLVKTVLGWYDFDTNYIDDGGQRRTAEKKNQNTLEWFNEHPLELKQKAYKIMLSKVHSTEKAKVQNTFGKLISEVSATPKTNELKEMKNIKETIKTIIREESEYETFFRKALDKAGKGIADMSDDEKKAFFTKIDTAWTGKGEKNEALVGGQKKLDIDGDGEIEASDLAALRAGKKADESINEQSDALELKGIKINKKSPITFVLEVSFVINDEVVVSYLTTGTQQDAQKLKSKIEKAFKAGKIVSPSGIGYYAYNESVINEEKYTVIDPKGNQMGASDKGQAVAIAKKKGGEKEGYFVVSNKNALKARRALEKFKGDFKNPKLKDMMADLFYESVEEASTSSAPGEWVAYLSMARGKKLLKTFDTARGAKMFLSKNVDKLLGGANVESVGIMTKKQWDEREAKYAIEGVVSEGKFEPNFAKKIEALIKKELGVSNLEAIGPRTGRVMNRQDYYFHIPNPTHGIVVSKKWFGDPYPDEYYVSLTNRLGQSQQETEVNHITDENVVLKTVSAIAKKYKKQLTYAAMSETKSVNELKKLPSGNFSIKVGYPTFADYEKKAKVGDTILKYDKRGGMIKTFVNGSELDKNAEKYLDTVNNITSGIVYLSKKGMKGVAQVPDYEKKEVGVLVLEAKSVSEAISDKDLPNWLFDDPIDFEDWYEGGMELANNKGKLAPFSSSDEKKLFQLVGMWQDAEGDYQFGRGDLGTGKTTGARSASYSAQDLIKKFLTQKGKVVKNEGNTFGAERAKAIAKGDDSFKVDGEPFKVTGVDAKDKENAKKFSNENTELPKATIPAAVQAKLDMAIEKIKDTKLSYNQKLSLIGKVMDGLGVDKGEFNKMASKLKGTMESVITEQLVPVDKKAVDAFFDKKPFEGKNLNSDGKVLKTVGVGSQEMFIHTPNGVKFVGKITGQYAQSVVQYVNKNYKSDLTETISEGNAFGMAVNAAKKEGLKEFEFNGKMYKVKTGSYEKNEAAKKPVVLSGFTLVPEKKK